MYCPYRISVADINRELNRRPHLTDSGKRLFRKTANVVATMEDYVLEDCRIILVDGNYLYIIFYSGDLRNRYVVLTVSLTSVIYRNKG